MNKPENPRDLPWLCRLRRHVWKRRPAVGGWFRDVCDRCVGLDEVAS